MKIALFVPAWPPGLFPNGIVTYASHIVPALRRLGHEVFVLTFNNGAPVNDPYTIDLRNYTSSSSLLSRIRWRIAPAAANFNEATSAIANAVRELVEKHRIEVFESEESFGWTSAVSRMKLLPVIVRLHGPWFLTGRFNDPDDSLLLHRRREQLEGNGIRDAQLVTASSSTILQAVQEHYHIDLTFSRVIPNPIDAATTTESTWDARNCNKDALLFVGRFDKLKGGDFILRAFSELAASNPRLRLTFIGPDKGVKVANSTIQSFEQFVRGNLPGWCRSRIDFHGHMSHADVMSLRARHFATLIGAQYDTMGYMLLEPMALGCPLVATAVGGITEVIKDKRNGLLVPSQDVSAMVAACRSLLEDHKFAATLGRQAWLDCREHYAPEMVAAQTVAAYQKAINVFKRRSPLV